MRAPVLCLLLPTLAAAWPALAHPQSDRVAGCYDLAVGPWTPPDEGDAENLYAFSICALSEPGPRMAASVTSTRSSAAFSWATTCS